MICPKCNQESNGNFCTYCGTALTQQPVNNPQGVKVIFVRDSAFTGAVIAFKVVVDGVEIGSLPNGGSIETTLTPGSHEVTFSMWSASNTHTITVPSCNAFTVHISMKMGLWKNQININSTNIE